MSVVLTELNSKTKELKEIHGMISDARKELADVNQEKAEESARMNEARSRADAFEKDSIGLEQDVKNKTRQQESVSFKNTQQEKNHLGRINELKLKEDKAMEKLADLKKIYDTNVNLFNENIRELKTSLRQLKTEEVTLSKELEAEEIRLEKLREEDKKIIKDRLKHEDKIRIREKLADAKDESLKAKEKDLVAMSTDMQIIYSRLKTLYAEVKPDVNLDRLIMQVN